MWLSGGLVDAGILNLRKVSSRVKFQVLDADGNDVTDQYYVTLVGEPLTVTKRPITVAVNSKSREYNGEALTADSVTIITSPGEVEAVWEEIAIFDADGNDVTNNYYIKPKPGKLIVWEA